MKIRNILLIIIGYLFFFYPSLTKAQSSQDWYMTGANPERTSWVSSSATNVNLEWYRPIEAFIDPKTQVIATENKLFISTSNGLNAFDLNGNLLWQFNTQFPLGDSPTVVSNVVYVGGHDHTIRALNASTGKQIWMFDKAGSGFDSNPLVINSGNGLKVYAGNRDGYFYAINANDGSLAWQFPAAGQTPLGYISFPAVYSKTLNRVFFVSNDMFAYSLDASTGNLINKSQKLEGEGFRSYWPVLYQDKVILRGAPNYRNGLDSIVFGLQDFGLDQYDDYVNGLERNDFFSRSEALTTFSSSSSNGSWPWPAGTTVLDGTRYQNYLAQKPWRRTYVVLNQNDLKEYTYENGKYAPIIYVGSKSGNAYPPIVMPDGVVYQTNIKSGSAGSGIPEGEIMGWKIGSKYLSLANGFKASDEPVAISGGGNIIYWTHLCDRNGIAIYDVTKPSRNIVSWIWGEDSLPGVSQVWKEFPSEPWDDDLHSYFNAGTNSVNGVYGCHGVQNPIVPYQGKLFVLRMNVLYAFGPGGGAVNKGKVTIAQTSPSYTQSRIPTKTELKQKLSREISKMISAGILRSGYHNDGQLAEFEHMIQLKDHFRIPGDTLMVLSMAYPHLDTSLKASLKTYLETEYNTYFANNFKGDRGYSKGLQREYADLPDDLDLLRNKYPASGYFEQSQYYGLSKYTTIFPEKASAVYEHTKGELNLGGSFDMNSVDGPWKINRAIMGLVGFLDLQQNAGKTSDVVNGNSRSSIQNKLNQLENTRKSFYKDIKSLDPIYNNTFPNSRQRFAISRNFMFLTPELGAFMGQNIKSQVGVALDEYTHVAPYWFVQNFDSTHSEGINQLLYDAPSLFLAKAYIMGSSYPELVNYLDTNHFAVGDLYFIHNLIATLNAPGDSNNTPLPTDNTKHGDIDKDGDVDFDDFNLLVIHFGESWSGADFDYSGGVDIFDFNILISNYGQ